MLVIVFDYRSGVSLSPLMVCRLLLVMDYLFYQFSGLPSSSTNRAGIIPSPIISPTCSNIYMLSCCAYSCKYVDFSVTKTFCFISGMWLYSASFTLIFYFMFLFSLSSYKVRLITIFSLVGSPSEATEGNNKEKPSANSQTPDVMKCTGPSFTTWGL